MADDFVERSSRWRDADSHADAAERYLAMVMRVLDAQKRQALDLLHLAPGMSAIDVGCGIGLDAEALAERVGPTGRVVGLDASRELIAKASARAASSGLPLSFEVGDAQALAFADDSFDAARIDRVLQHLPEPEKAVREMVRVVRPGGRIAALEPDWDTIAVAGVDVDVTRCVVRHKADLAIAHGTIGRELRRLLVQAGCRDVVAESGAVAFYQLGLADQVLALRRNLDGAREQGWISAEQATDWWTGLEAHDRAGTFFTAMSGVIAGATVA
jgi:SAM-dependent methyltransferase